MSEQLGPSLQLSVGPGLCCSVEAVGGSCAAELPLLLLGWGCTPSLSPWLGPPLQEPKDQAADKEPGSRQCVCHLLPDPLINAPLPSRPIKALSLRSCDGGDSCSLLPSETTTFPVPPPREAPPGCFQPQSSQLMAFPSSPMRDPRAAVVEGLSSAGVFRAAKSQRGRVWGSQNLRRCLSASPNLLTRWQLGWMSRYPLVCFVFFPTLSSSPC